MRRSRSLLLALALLTTACAREIREDERVLHQRAVLRTEADGGVSIAELQDVDAGPPNLTVRRIGPGGEEGAATVAAPDQAAATAEAVRGGKRLEQAIPEAWGPVRSVSWSSDPVEIAGPLAGWVLRIERIDDPRYGPAQAVLLDLGDQRVELGRLDAAARVRLAQIGPSLAASTMELGAGSLQIRDVAVYDLRVGAARLHEEQAQADLDAGRLEAARSALDHAELLAPGRAPAAFLRARLEAASGAPVEKILEPLARAIEADPSLYRMYARTAPDFEAIRGDAGFAELVRQRPLPGSNRAGVQAGTQAKN